MGSVPLNRGPKRGALKPALCEDTLRWLTTNQEEASHQRSNLPWEGGGSSGSDADLGGNMGQGTRSHTSRLDLVLLSLTEHFLHL